MCISSWFSVLEGLLPVYFPAVFRHKAVGTVLHPGAALKVKAVALLV